MMKEILQLQILEAEVGKRRVFSRLFFRLCEGEIAELVFSSNSEKNDFINLLRGECTIKDGITSVFEERLDGSNFNKRITKLTAYISNHSSLLSNLSIIDNLLFANKERFLPLKKQCRMLTEAIEKLGIELSINKDVMSLTTNERILVEILRAYLNGNRIILLNISWSEMTPGDATEIIDVLSKLTGLGVGIILVENIERNLISIGKNYYYIKSGQTIGCFPRAIIETKSFRRALLTEKGDLSDDEDYDDLDRLSFGKELKVSFSFDQDRTSDHVAFSIQKDEVIKLFFVNNEELKLLGDCLTGKKVNNQVVAYLDGARLPIGRQDLMVSEGVVVMNESDPSGVLLTNLSVADNILLIRSNKGNGSLFQRKYYAAVVRVVEEYMGPGIADKKVADLSEEMKIILRYLIWLVYKPRLLIVINPLFDKDKAEYSTVRKMISLLKRRSIPVILFLNNIVDINSFEGNTLFVENGIIVEQFDAYMKMLGEGF